jgi:Trk-type K+ transport system membrane component
MYVCCWHTPPPNNHALYVALEAALAAPLAAVTAVQGTTVGLSLNLPQQIDTDFDIAPLENLLMRSND